eukprot:scaffold40998_cov63-Phaeocystis_antarctica.AAC.2
MPRVRLRPLPDQERHAPRQGISPTRPLPQEDGPLGRWRLPLPQAARRQGAGLLGAGHGAARAVTHAAGLCASGLPGQL